MARLGRSACCLAVVAVLAGCGSKDQGSPPLVFATVIGVAPGHGYPGLAGAAEVIVADAAGTAAITTATVRVNGVVMPYVAETTAYAGPVGVRPGEPVTVSVTGAGRDVSVTVQQASSFATITAPTSGGTWSGLISNTVTWNPAVPPPGEGYFVNVADLQGNFIWPSGGGVQQVAASVTSLEIPAGSLTEGARILLVGGATLHPFPAAAPESGVLLLGFDGVPFDVTAGTLVASAPGAAQLLATAGRVVWTDASDAPVKSVPATGGPPTVVVERHHRPESALQVGGNLYWISGTQLLRSGLDGTATTVLAEGPRETFTGGMGDLAVDANAAYWVNTVPDGCSPSCTQALVKVPLSGGPAVTLATTRSMVRGIAAADTHLYWVQEGIGPLQGDGRQPTDSGVRAVPKAGGEVTILVDGWRNEPPPTLPPGFIPGNWMTRGGIAVDAGRVVYSDTSFGGYRILSVPVAGGAVTVLFETSGVEGSDYARQIVVAGGAAYWIDLHAIRAAPVVGGAASTLVSGIPQGVSLAVGLGQVAWVETECCAIAANGRIRAAPIFGGAATTLAALLDFPEGVRIDDAAAVVTWVEGGSYGQIDGFGRIGRVPLSGGAATTAIGALFSTTPRIASDGTSVFLADGWRVKRAPLSGGAPENAVSASNGVAAVATDGIRLVTLVSDGTLLRTPVAGGATEVLFAGGAPGQPGSSEVVVSAGVVTWVTPHAVDPGKNVLRRIPVTGGSVVTVASDLPVISALVADADAAYYAVQGSGEIYRVAAAGGARTLLAAGLAQSPVALAIDGTSLYWADPYHVGQVDLGSLKARFRVAFLGLLEGGCASQLPNLVAVDADRFYWTQGCTGVLKRSDGK